MGSPIRLVSTTVIELFNRMANIPPNSIVALLGSRVQDANDGTGQYLFIISDSTFIGIDYQPKRPRGFSVKNFAFSDKVNNVLCLLELQISDLSPPPNPNQNLAPAFFANNPLIVSSGTTSASNLFTQQNRINLPSGSTSSQSNVDLRSSYQGGLIQGLDQINTIFATQNSLNPATQPGVTTYYDPVTKRLIQTRVTSPAPQYDIYGRIINSSASSANQQIMRAGTQPAGGNSSSQNQLPAQQGFFNPRAGSALALQKQDL